MWTTGIVIGAIIGAIFWGTLKVVSFGTIIIVLTVLWTALNFLVVLIRKREGKNLTAKDFFQNYFRPIKYLITVPNKNLEYKCPRCDGTDYYSSREQVSGGAVGGIINNPNGPDFGVMRPISYDVNVYRCKSCNTEMDEYISTLFHNWKESWRNIGYSIFIFFLCVLFFDIIVPWAIEY
jgi:hypothetical protein